MVNKGLPSLFEYVRDKGIRRLVNYGINYLKTKSARLSSYYRFLVMQQVTLSPIGPRKMADFRVKVKAFGDQRFAASIPFYLFASDSFSDKCIVALLNDPLSNKVLDYAVRIKYRHGVSLGYRFNECCNLVHALHAVDKIPGDIAEVGVAHGGTAKLLSYFKKGRKLFLFDTFEGLPEPSECDGPAFWKGKFAASYEKVCDYFHDNEEVYIFKGLFPQTGRPIEDKTFALVHIDCDLYQSALDCLKFFYPRLNAGGVIITHDYAAGVKKAFQEFFADKEEGIMRLPGTTQAIVFKLSSPGGLV